MTGSAGETEAPRTSPRGGIEEAVFAIDVEMSIFALPTATFGALVAAFIQAIGLNCSVAWPSGTKQKLVLAAAGDTIADIATSARTMIETKLALNGAVLTASNICVAQYLFRDLSVLVGGGKWSRWKTI